jgi:hypothetical protein
MLLPYLCIGLADQRQRRRTFHDFTDPGGWRVAVHADVLHAGVKRDPTKFSNSRNAGPHSTFLADRAAFRCVSPIEGERPGP